MRKVLLVGGDLMAGARIEGAARHAGLEFQSVGDDRLDKALSEDVALVVLDLDSGAERALELLPHGTGPEVVGYFSHVDAELGRRAEAAGCKVMPRGRFWRTLPDLLASL